MSPLSRPDAAERPQIVARLQRMVERWPQVSGCHLNPDPVVVRGIVGALAQSVLDTGYSYCPCRDRSGDPEQDRALICPCAFHQDEIIRDGHCKCVLFVGDQYDPERAYTFRQSEEMRTMQPIQSLRQRDITVYLTQWCGQSRRTKQWLRAKGIAYQEIDIDADDEAAQRVREYNQGYRSVPTVVIHLIITEPSADELQGILGTPELTVMRCDAYVTRWCGQSRRTLAWLEEHQIAARAIDIEADASAADQVRTRNGGNESVPTLDLLLRLTEPTTEQLQRALGLGQA
jgi:ferredoxin-thioredoxin reductase catalytic subunit/glutaredoxin